MPLGAEDGRLVPGSFSASSYYNHYLAPWHGRLSHRWSWSVRQRRHGQWLQVSLGSSSTVKGIATQGRQDANQWVKQYTISHSKDGMRFIPYNEGRGTVVIKKSLHKWITWPTPKESITRSPLTFVLSVFYMNYWQSVRWTWLDIGQDRFLLRIFGPRRSPSP